MLNNCISIDDLEPRDQYQELYSIFQFIFKRITSLIFVALYIYFRRILIHMTSFESWWWSHKKPSYLATDNYNFLEMIAYFMHERCSISWRHFVVKGQKMHVDNVILNVVLFIYFCLRHLLPRRLVALPVNCISYFLVHAVWQILNFSLNLLRIFTSNSTYRHLLISFD